jgi:hypothetical protein
MEMILKCYVPQKTSQSRQELSDCPEAKILNTLHHNNRTHKELINNGGDTDNAILIRLEPKLV